MLTAFSDFIDVLTDFVITLLPLSLSSAIMVVVCLILGLAAWRIIS